MRRITDTTIAIALALTFGVATRASAQSCTATGPNAGPFSIDGCVKAASNSKLAGDAIAVIDSQWGHKGAWSDQRQRHEDGHHQQRPNTDARPDESKRSGGPEYHLHGNDAPERTFGRISGIYFGWKRDSNNGSGFVSIEFRRMECQRAHRDERLWRTKCNPWSGRQTGDFLILWDQQGGSTEISIRFFNQALNAFGPKIDLNSAQAVATYSPDFFRGELGDRLFSGRVPQRRCLSQLCQHDSGNSYRQLRRLTTRTQFCSAFPPVSNCGAVTIKKVTVPTGLTGSFAYTLSRSPGGASSTVLVDTDCADGTNKTECKATLTGDGDSTRFRICWRSLTSRLPRICLCRTGSSWRASSARSTETNYDVKNGSLFPVVATKTTACVITNKLNIGTLIVKKVVVNNNGGTLSRSDFSYKIDTGIQAQIAFVDNTTGASVLLADATV